MPPVKMARSARALLLSVLLIAQYVVSPPASAAPGELDLNFGSAGKAATAFGSGDDVASGMALQSDGKLVVAGDAFNGSNFDFAVARYTKGGVLDPAFGTEGKVTTPIGPGDDRGHSVVIQPDGKIVVGGSSLGGDDFEFAVVRYNVDGSLDPSFDTDGKAVTSFGFNDEGYGIGLQPDGKIVVAGFASNGTNFDFAVARFNPNGTLDPGFGTNGKVVTPVGVGDDLAFSVVIQGDGKIVIGGSAYNGASCVTDGANCDFALARYNPDGTLDEGFGSGGKVTTAFGSVNDGANALAIQSDGKVVAAGFSTQGNDLFALARYNLDGTLDTSFGTGGKVTTAVGSDGSIFGLLIQPDGKIVSAGFAFAGVSAFGLARYNSDGSLDTTFGTGGQVTTRVGDGDVARGAALQPDGKIVAAGETFNGSDLDFGLTRYLSGQEVFKPDALVGLASGPLSGDDVYNLTGQGQTKSVRAARGKKKTFVVGVVNDGNDTDSLHVEGPGSSNGFTVKYVSGGTNLTSGVLAGDAAFRDAAPGEGGVFRVEVSVKKNAAVGATKTLLITFTSQGDRTKQDVVKIRVKAV